MKNQPTAYVLTFLWPHGLQLSSSYPISIIPQAQPTQFMSDLPGLFASDDKGS